MLDMETLLLQLFKEQIKINNKIRIILITVFHEWKVIFSTLLLP